MQTYQFAVLCLMNLATLTLILSNIWGGLDQFAGSCPKSADEDTRANVDKIQHKFLSVKGLNLHVAELGAGPNVVVFLHGFPGTWYSLRHQMAAVAGSGYRAIAPECRGFGLSQQLREAGKTTYMDLVTDLADILDSLGISRQVFVVAEGFGTRVANQFALMYPNRVRALVTIGLPFAVMNTNTFPVNLIPEGYYMMRFQEPGRAEKDFARFDVRTVVRSIYILFSGTHMPEANKDQEIMDLVDPSSRLPSWLTEEDLSLYANLYANNGFRTPLQIYRQWLEGYGVKDLKVRTPSLLIMGDKDYVLTFGGLDDYIKSGKVREYVPDLETVFIRNGTHFVQEQFPEKISNLMLNFLHKHKY